MPHLPELDFTSASTGAHRRVGFDGQVTWQTLKGYFPISLFSGQSASELQDARW
jgi:hypothetical protein